LVSNTVVFLNTTDGSPCPETPVPVYVQGSPVVIHEPLFSTTFVPGTFSSEEFDTSQPVYVNSNINLDTTYELRDLNSDVMCTPLEPKVYLDLQNKGFSQGSILSLFAVGPQDEYLTSNAYVGNQFSAKYIKYSNFVMYQRVIPFPPPNPSYQGNVLQVELRPTELGHLLSNMYMKVKMPAIKGYTYSEHVGRALIKQIDLLVNETVIETIYDDWYVIKDQLFLDADEQYSIFSAINVKLEHSVPDYWYRWYNHDSWVKYSTHLYAKRDLFIKHSCTRERVFHWRWWCRSRGHVLSNSHQ
jgi:hypothetical protein